MSENGALLWMFEKWLKAAGRGTRIEQESRIEMEQSRWDAFPYTRWLLIWGVVSGIREVLLEEVGYVVRE